MTTSVGAAAGAVLLGLLFVAAGVTFVMSDEEPESVPDPIDATTGEDTGKLFPGRVAFAIGFFLMGGLAIVWGGHALYQRSR